MRDKLQEFQRLVEEAASCRACPRLADQPAVLGPGNGPWNARVLFIAEAPGRLGAGRTGIPFSGDRSGENFEILLRHAGLTRDEVFITNAALCNPLQNTVNRRPTAAEIHNCSYYLKTLLGIIEPQLVVTLGTVALQALNPFLKTKYRLSQVAARPLPGFGFILLPLYHPSPRVTHWRRPLSRQKRDFKKILRLLTPSRSPQNGQEP
ncbi:MAG: uracil-DNA glycosylase [Nitrospinaceae bacterium]